MKRKTEHEETKMRFLPFLFPSLPFPSSSLKAHELSEKYGHLVILPFFMLGYWICRLFVEDRQKRK